MKEPLDPYDAATAPSEKLRYAVSSGKRRACFPLLSRVLVLGACAAGTLIGGCGGGNSSAPSGSQFNALGGIYTMSVNRTSTGTVANASLPTGTGTLAASRGRVLDSKFDLVDATRSPDPSQVVTTVAEYGDMTGTFSTDGSFDLRGRVRDFVTTNGVITSVTTGQTARLQGQLPRRSGSTTVTVTVGSKTTTGTLVFTSELPTPTPTPTPTPSAE